MAWPLERLLLDPVQVVIVGSGAEAERLEALAVAGFAVNKTVMRIAPSRLVPGGIPEALAETLLQVPAPAGAEAWALVCRGRTCLPPVTDAEALGKGAGASLKAPEERLYSVGQISCFFRSLLNP